MKTRTLWLVISLLVIASVVLASCGPKTSTGGGNYLTINFEQVSTWVRNFNPFSPDALGSTVTAIYEPMMIYNKSVGELVPWLATEYSWSADNITLTFNIREGVKWSDGQPFTARDVLFTFDMLRNNLALSGSGTGVLSEYVDSFTSPDDSTIVFNFKSVYTAALYDIANQIIVPEHIWKDVQDPTTWTNETRLRPAPSLK
jgi:peptide/nickel transport system substrate-binding protein